MTRHGGWLWFALGVTGVWWVATRAKAQTVAGSQQLTASPGNTLNSLPIQAGTQTIPELPSTLAPSGTMLARASDFWSTLTPVAPIDSGFINFPSGTQVAAALMSAGNTRMDGNGNYYVQWAGQVYQLGIQDSSGNWPAILAQGS